MMEEYRITRTHLETYVVDVDADSPENALEIAKRLDPSVYEHVESSAYEYEVSIIVHRY